MPAFLLRLYLLLLGRFCYHLPGIGDLGHLVLIDFFNEKLSLLVICKAAFALFFEALHCNKDGTTHLLNMLADIGNLHIDVSDLLFKFKLIAFVHIDEVGLKSRLLGNKFGQAGGGLLLAVALIPPDAAEKRTGLVTVARPNLLLVDLAVARRHKDDGIEACLFAARAERAEVRKEDLDLAVEVALVLVHELVLALHNSVVALLDDGDHEVEHDYLVEDAVDEPDEPERGDDGVDRPLC